jgi:hypothetical protein
MRADSRNVKRSFRATACGSADATANSAVDRCAGTTYRNPARVHAA